MHISTNEIARKPLNTNLKETYEIGKQLYREGVNSYQAVHKAIRYLGFYLYMGDEDKGVPSMKDDDEGRAKLIYDLIMRGLFWSKEKAKELWCDVFNACKWRKGKEVKKLVPEQVKEEPKLSSSSINSFNRSSSPTITICDSNSKKELEPAQRTASKEEIRSIFKSVLGDKCDFDNPKGLFATGLRSLRL